MGLLAGILLTASVANAQHARMTRVETVDLGHGVKLELVLIRPGTFTMGSTTDGHDGPAHSVTLTNAFYIGRYEVTQAQWQALTGDNPSRFKDEPDAAQRPVESVSWTDVAEKFLPPLNARLPAGWHARLPTEAEWEYCCRAGTTTRYCFGEDAKEFADYGWCEGNTEKLTHPVGQKKPNAWGLYDMHGNVWEWCADWKAEYPSGAVTNPVGPATGDNRANRGGGWSHSTLYCSSFRRSLNDPRGTRGGNLGFRVVVTIDSSTAGSR